MSTSHYLKTISRLARAEGKKHQMSIGDARELAGLIAEEMIADVKFHVEMVTVGYGRFKKRPKPQSE